LCRAGAELAVLNKAGKRSAPLWNTSFSNEVQDKQGKPECTSYFETVPKPHQMIFRLGAALLYGGRDEILINETIQDAFVQTCFPRLRSYHDICRPARRRFCE
jgi:hypothetical protein